MSDLAGTVTEAPDGPRRQSPRWLRSGASRGAVVGSFVVLAAAYFGMANLHDNSFFTHLATGHLILDGHVPTVDPYSFTAPGHPWVVQSWFASLLYASSEKIGHGLGIRLMIMLLSVVLALVVWRLTRPAKSVVARIVAILPALAVGTVNWGPRPLLFGLVGFALVLLVLREERDPRWLVPVMWVWVNTHGSFPLAFVLVVIYGFGARLDGGSFRHASRTLLWIAIGTVAGALNPLGLKLLWFPVELLSKQDVLRHMTEWQAPGFQSEWQRAFLVGVIGAAALAPRLPRGDRYRLLLPALAFSALGFDAMRNIALATLLLAPLLAVELSDLGSLSSRSRTRGHTLVVGTVLVIAAVVVGVRATAPSFDFATYPVKPFDDLQAQGRLRSPHRVAAEDIVGNYMELRYLGKVPVFVDDRVDMYPKSVIEDELSLIHAQVRLEQGSGSVEDRYGGVVGRLATRLRALAVEELATRTALHVQIDRRRLGGL